MKMFLSPQKIKQKTTATKKFRNFLVVFCLLFILAAPLQPAHAQIGGVVTDIGNTIASWTKYAWDKASSYATTLWQKAGSIAYQRALSTALNKIAYDTATWIGSGHSGQKPMYVTEGWPKYLRDTGDAAAGQFVESFVNNLNNPGTDCGATLKSCQSTCDSSYSSAISSDSSLSIQTNASSLAYSAHASCLQTCATNNTSCAVKNTSAAMQSTPSFNVCSPSSVAAKIQIGLGLVNENQPQAPDCTASQMIKNWGTDINQKLADLHNPNYLSTFVGLFNPSANDLGIYVQAKSDMSSKALVDTQNAQTGLIAKGGWLDVTNIAGSSLSAPGTAARQLQEVQDVQSGNLGKISGDVFVDAANVFLNQLALSAFNKLVQSIGSASSGGTNQAATTNTTDPGSTSGATVLQETTTKLLQPNFGTQADYDILSSLAVCPDATNPGPDNCVIDSQFMQAISEKKTIAEGLSGGYLHGDWQITNETSGGAYNSSYSLRDIEILVKYRILPIGWEQAAASSTDPTNPKKATLMDLVSCFDPNDQYNTFSANFSADHTWCQGLVDPNWVLKAPMNYCQKQGFGAQINNTTIIPGVDENGVNTPSTLSITRADSYCADGQTCIQEKSDGSCEAYGYCNGEQRTWNFSADSCDPVNNTCQAFTGPSGQSVAYLENTLNYASCDSSNAGCLQYSLTGSYASSTDTVTWSTSKSLYLNKNLAACTSGDEGCTGLIRVRPTWGTNLVMDSGFTNDTVGDTSSGSRLNDWPVYGSATIVDASQEPGGVSGSALKLTNVVAPAGVFSNSANSLLPDNLQIIPGQAYTLSADVYLTQGANVQLIMGDASDGYVATTATANGWQHLTVTRAADSSYNDPAFSIIGNTGTAAAGARVTFYLKNVKFEMSNFDTGYSAYGAANVIHEKLIPAYLESACYVNATGASKDYSLKTDAPTVCSNFARKCNQDEVGCDLYKNIADSFTVPGRVTSQDYCPQQCLGYDVYVARGSYFNSPASENLIPSTATTCSAAAAGCSEFTNLDTLAAGGEQKEYYTQLKQCIKPNATQCASFYTWAGQTDGYQLQAYSLEKDANGLPAVTSDDSAACNAAIYNLPISDPSFNPDCQQFYTAAGAVSYHLISRTITCSDDCHAYRMTNKNVDSTLTSASCTGSDKHWDAATNSCNSCLNGGTWDTTTGACIYQAIPGEGQTCTAAQNGCREYNGNNGSNVQLLASYDFEGGLGGWTSNCSSGNGVSLSTISNAKSGHSLQYNANTCANMNVAVSLSGAINASSAYTVKFLARADAGANLQLSLVNTGTGATAAFSAVAVKGDGNWNIYEANLPSTGTVAATSTNEFLTITSSNSFYLDDLVLSEITDRYYLLQGSSQIPDACYYDTFDNYQGANYNLGCAEYTDRAGLKNDLRQFTKLCSDSAVGCEQMIDTKNYSPYGSGAWESGVATTTCDTVGDPNCVTVAGDSAIYAVYDSTKQCSASSQGCSRMGQGQGGANLTGWSDVYEINNPDKYSSILCAKAGVGCQSWTSSTDSSVSYFKDPGYQACTYRASQSTGSQGQKAWYKIPAKRCDLNGDGAISGSEIGSPICLSNSDCSSGTCLTDNNDYACTVRYDKTVGLGGAGNQVPVPSEDVGVCDAGSSSCTEYIDPVSQFNANQVFNPGFVQTCSSSNCVQDGWGATASGKWTAALASNQQVITLNPNTLYSFYISSGAANSAVTLAATSSILQLSNNNIFSTITGQITAGGSSQPAIFDSLGNTSALVSGGSSSYTITVKPLAIAYKLQTGVDKTSCNGQAQFSNGCVLFNERSINGAAGPATLSFDAQATTASTTANPVSPVSCSSSGSCTANQVIKVQPDRVCSQWLSCTSYIQDPTTHQKTCYAFGECNRLDSKGECVNFTDTGINATVLDASSANATGYSMLARYNLNQMSVVGRNADLTPDGDFEGISTSTAPILPICPAINSSGTPNPGTCQINSPDAAATTAGTDYPAHGNTYLRVITGPGDEWDMTSAVNVTKSADFYINYLTNTKNAVGQQARVRISNADTGAVLATFDSQADSGWTREVNKFTLTNVKNIKVALTSNATILSKASVYFDDVSIQPVLQTGAGQYAAPECRLYPTADSLTCTSKSKNTISEGLQGYCLEHDPANTNVCLLWYPMDSIPTPNYSSMGYQGKFPLNYCVAANGSFDLAEKRNIYMIENDAPAFSASNAYSCLLGKSTDFNSCDGNTDYWQLNYTFGCNNSANCCTQVWCIPKTPGKVEATVKRDRGINPDTYSASHDFGAFSGDLIHSSAYTMTDYNGRFPKSDVNWEQWTITVNLEANPSQGPEGWYIYNGLTSQEAANYDPPIAVYDYTNPPSSESQLKFPYSTSTTANVYHVTCSQFTQAVDSSGNNIAWAQRVSSQASDLDSTPTFLKQPFDYGLQYYGQNRDSAPFGAAQDNASAGSSTFKDAFNGTTPFAGRPYGCDNNSLGQGCDLLGYCSGDSSHNTYCLATSTVLVNGVSLSNKTCGNLGTCLPLWSTSTPLLNTSSTPPPYANILKNIFLKFGNYDYSAAGTNHITACSNYFDNFSHTYPTGNVRTDPNSFCFVYPTISHIHLYYGDSKLEFKAGSVQQTGLYRLEFNTKLDAEQEPVKEIDINWGDGHTQTVTDQDDRSLITAPHVFYHWYSAQTATIPAITLTDNWGFYCNSANAGNCYNH